MKRIRNYDEITLSDADITKIHGLKEDFFAKLVPEKLYLRPNVKHVLNHATTNGLQLGFITTTSQRNIDLLKEGLSLQLDLSVFDLITTAKDVSQPKPNPEVYQYALNKLNMKGSDAIVIEDTPTNQKCAAAAGLKCILFPGEYAEIPENNRYNTLTYNLLDKLEPLLIAN